MSSIDSIVDALYESGVQYKLTILGTVRGSGNNDILDKVYTARKLEYHDFVILEQLIKNIDCDADDYFVSVKFSKDKEPKNWKIEVIIDEDGNIIERK